MNWEEKSGNPLPNFKVKLTTFEILTADYLNGYNSQHECPETIQQMQMAVDPKNKPAFPVAVATAFYILLSN